MGAWVDFGLAALRWRWPLVGLVLTLTLLGHDIAMAQDAHGITTTPSLAAGEHHRPHASKLPPTFLGQHPEHLPQRDCGIATCPALATCRVGWAAAPTSRVDADVAAPLTAGDVEQLLQEHHAARLRLLNNAAPPPSPAVRRALLQVFLN